MGLAERKPLARRDIAYCKLNFLKGLRWLRGKKIG